MIYRMACDLAERLADRKYPVAFAYGPERISREGPFDHLVTVARDRELGDGNPEAPIGSARNARYTAARRLGVVIRVFAASTVEGARINEHEWACDQIVDAVVVELYKWAKEAKAGPIEFRSARYVDVSQLDVGDQRPGVVYELRIGVNRGVYDKDLKASP
jgi:hypothetical protein